METPLNQHQSYICIIQNSSYNLHPIFKPKIKESLLINYGIFTC